MAHKVTFEEKSIGTPLDTLREGEFGIVVSAGAYEGHVALKTENSAVSLGDGTFIDNLWSTKVRKFAPGSKFTVEVLALINLTFAQEERVKVLLRGGDKIPAIKYVREITGAGLYEAKQYTDTVVF